MKVKDIIPLIKGNELYCIAEIDGKVLTSSDYPEKVTEFLEFEVDHIESCMWFFKFKEQDVASTHPGHCIGINLKEDYKNEKS